MSYPDPSWYRDDWCWNHKWFIMAVTFALLMLLLPIPH